MAIIEKPINLINVANTLGYYEYKPHPVTGVNSRYVDLGRLCTHPNINKWAKYKPYVDTRISPPANEHWKVSDMSASIRSGLLIRSETESLWEYPKSYIGTAYRAGDFEGYSQNANIESFYLNFPNEIFIDEPYTCGFIFNGSLDVSSISFDDLFNLQTRDCFMVVEMLAGTKSIKEFSPKIPYREDAILYGIEFSIPWSKIEPIVNEGGQITMETYFVEADDFGGGNIQNIEKFSLRAHENIKTKHRNMQFSAEGFIVYSNFDTLQPSKNNLTVSSSGYELVAVSSSFRTGGLFSGYYFQAKIIVGNQLGQNYTYALPTHNLAPNETKIMAIPDFSLALLEDKAVELEYSVWDGFPENSTLIFSRTYKL